MSKTKFFSSGQYFLHIFVENKNSKKNYGS